MSLEKLFDKCFNAHGKNHEEPKHILETLDDDALQADIMTPLNEVSEIDLIRMKLSVPEIMPCTFDGTIEFWLKRIAFWGKKDKPFNIEYTDPEGRKKNVSIDDFRKSMTEPEEIVRVFGKWDLKKESVKSFTATREFYDASGRKRKEKYFVDINLDKDIEDAIKGKF